MTEQQITDFDRWFDQFMDPELSLTPGDKELCRHAWQAALSHAEGEVVDHWAVRNPGLADQFRAEAQAVRKRLGFESDADDVSPNDLRERIAEIEGAPQVAGLTETAIKSSPAYRALHREKEHLLGLLKDQAPQVAVPEGFTVVPVREFYVMSEDEDIIGEIGNDFEAGKHLLKLAQEGEPDKAWSLVADIDQTKLAAPTAPAGEKPVSDPDGLPSDWRRVVEGAADMLGESAKQHRGRGDNATASMCDRFGAMLRDEILSAPAPDEREIAALREDAARWRYVRTSLPVRTLTSQGYPNIDCPRDPETSGHDIPAWLDGTVDAARLRGGKEGE